MNHLLMVRVSTMLSSAISWLCLRCILLACLAAAYPHSARSQPINTAQLEPLTYEPVALAWSPSEVEAASMGNLELIKERAANRNELGCQRYCARLNQVFERLLPHARVQSSNAARLNWSLTVVQLADIDAMALPGGQIIISEHFIQKQNLSDEALAFVLAHEMSHSILEHERQVLTFARMLLPRDVHRDVGDVYTEMEFNRKLSKAIEPLMQQGEFEADELGLLLAAKAGYDPEHQLAFVAAEAAKGAAPKAMLDTHPSAHQRLKKLQERLVLARRLTPQ